VQSRRGSLTRDQIVEAAIQLVDTEGPSALSTRRLGRALGVRGMAIYWHLPSMDALIDAMLEKIWDGVYENPNAPPDDWYDHMRKVMESIRQVGMEHPQVFALLATRPAPERQQRMAEANIALLRRAHFSDELAQYAIHTLFGHVFWNVMGEVRGYYGTPAPQGRGSRVRRNRLFGPGLDIILTGLRTLVARKGF
jgi:AcrR family transcriptional regulator